MPATTEEFTRQLKAFVAYHEIYSGNVNTAERWKERKETMCDFAVVHLTSEDIRMVNGEFDDAIHDLCNAYDWCMDRGYHWSWHFWPEDHPPAQINVINADIHREPSRPLAPGESPF